MAELGSSGTYRITDVADVLKVTISSLGPVRSRIINKGMIYSPAHGDIAFTDPLFSEFILRAMTDLKI